MHPTLIKADIRPRERTDTHDAQPTQENRGSASEELPPPRLSPRMVQVLELRARGMTYNQIAKQLGLSISTVKTRVCQAKARLRANSNLEAIAIASRADLIRI
jgi:DNA-binding NarL/FixJ family response regulator